MKLEMSSVKTILGDSKEVMVYGFGSCQYVYVCKALNALKFKAIVKDTFKDEFEMLDYDQESHMSEVTQVPDSDDYQEYFQREKTIIFARECKTLITSLCVFNLKRKQNNEPIMPLLFCVESEIFGDVPVSIDIKKVAESHPMQGTFITHEELRRCFKMIYFETAPEFKAIIKETFKFVRVISSREDNTSCQLQPISPFWEKPEWAVAWSKRQPMNTPAELRVKKFPWREVTNKKVTSILQSQTIFKSLSTANEAGTAESDSNIILDEQSTICM